MLPSLAAAVINFALSIYIFFFYRKTRANLVLSCLLLTISLTAVGETFSRAAGEDLVRAVFWDTLIIAGGVLTLCVFLYFVLIYPDELKKSKTVHGRGIIAASFIFGIFFIINAIAGAFSIKQGDIKPTASGFYSISDMSIRLGGDLYITSVIYIGIMVFACLAVILWRYRRENRQNKKALRVIIFGAAFMFITGFFTELALPLFLVIPPGGLADMGMLMMGIALFYVVYRYRNVLIQPEKEEKQAELTSPFEKRFYYVVVEETMANPERSYGIFCEHVKAGIQGLIVTSMEPAVIRKKYGLARTPIICISGKETSGISIDESTENVFYTHPTALKETLGIVVKFLGENRGAAIIVDCVGYLFAQNKSPPQRFVFLETVRELLKFIMRSDALLIVPMEATWVHVKDERKIIKMDQLMRASNLWPILLLEHLCNMSLKSLENDREKEVSRVIGRLGKIEKFFTFFKYENGEISIAFNYRMKFSYRDMIHYFKLFVGEIKAIAPVDMPAIISTMGDYGVSRNEYDLEPGNAYLLFTSNQEQHFMIFREFIERGYRGLYLGRTNPRNYRNLPEGTRARIRFGWITDSGSGEQAVSPKLEYLRKGVEDFINENPDANRIVFIDNIEYLVKHSGSFDDVHLFIATLRDVITPKDGILVIPATGKTLSENEKSVLTQELAELDYSDE